MLSRILINKYSINFKVKYNLGYINFILLDLPNDKIFAHLISPIADIFNPNATMMGHDARIVGTCKSLILINKKVAVGKVHKCWFCLQDESYNDQGLTPLYFFADTQLLARSLRHCNFIGLCYKSTCRSYTTTMFLCDATFLCITRVESMLSRPQYCHLFLQQITVQESTFILWPWGL